MTRKITQIAADGDGGILALCADSSIWLYAAHGFWNRLPDIPGDETTAAPKKRAPREGCTIQEFLIECKETGVKAIPEDHPVMTYAREAKIPDEFLKLHWLEFKDRHIDNGKRYKDWRAAFSKSVRGNWFKLWYITGDTCALTTVGQQAKNLYGGAA